MQLGFVGLGRMGGGMVERLLGGGHSVAACDRAPEARRAVALKGAAEAASLDDLVRHLAPPRAVWLMVPAGGPTEETIRELGARLSAGDILIDGGNTFWKDDLRRAADLARLGLTTWAWARAGACGG